MINHRTSAFIFLAAAVLLFVAAVLSPHEENIMDIVFFGLSLLSGTIGVNMFKKHRNEKRFGLY